MMYVGQWEARAGDMVRELVALDDVLFADDLAFCLEGWRELADAYQHAVPGDREPLTLSAGQLDASFADNRVQRFASGVAGAAQALQGKCK